MRVAHILCVAMASVLLALGCRAGADTRSVREPMRT